MQNQEPRARKRKLQRPIVDALLLAMQAWAEIFASRSRPVPDLLEERRRLLGELLSFVDVVSFFRMRNGLRSAVSACGSLSSS